MKDVSVRTITSQLFWRANPCCGSEYELKSNSSWESGHVFGNKIGIHPRTFFSGNGRVSASIHWKSISFPLNRSEVTIHHLSGYMTRELFDVISFIQIGVYTFFCIIFQLELLIYVIRIQPQTLTSLSLLFWNNCESPQ